MKVAALTKTLIAIGFSTLVLFARGATTSAKQSDFVNRVLELTNQQRSKYGLPPLVLSQNLTKSAEWKAEDMATRNYFEHLDYSGHDFVDRANENGYGDWVFLGENIAAGQRSPEEVVQEWMESPEHRENILKRSYHEIGIGFASEGHSSFGRYWVQEFGAR
jgi:uncharacterized protein YkwD